MYDIKLLELKSKKELYEIVKKIKDELINAINIGNISKMTKQQLIDTIILHSPKTDKIVKVLNAKTRKPYKKREPKTKKMEDNKLYYNKKSGKYEKKSYEI